MCDDVTLYKKPLKEKLQKFYLRGFVLITTQFFANIARCLNQLIIT